MRSFDVLQQRALVGELLVTDVTPELLLARVYGEMAAQVPGRVEPFAAELTRIAIRALQARARMENQLVFGWIGHTTNGAG